MGTYEYEEGCKEASARPSHPISECAVCRYIAAAISRTTLKFDSHLYSTYPPTPPLIVAPYLACSHSLCPASASPCSGLGRGGPLPGSAARPGGPYRAALRDSRPLRHLPLLRISAAAGVGWARGEGRAGWPTNRERGGLAGRRTGRGAGWLADGQGGARKGCRPVPGAGGCRAGMLGAGGVRQRVGLRGDHVWVLLGSWCGGGGGGVAGKAVKCMTMRRCQAQCAR